MNWMERMERAIDYVEAHLTEEIDYSEVARAAATSAYHFPRMFMSLTDMTLADYIRRRRLSCAARELQSSDARVIDVAVRYGYESADAFSRAFYRQHSMMPSQVRLGGVQLTYYPRLSFHLTIKGDVPMNYRLEEIDFPIRVVGKKFPVDTATAFLVIPEIWKRETESGLVGKLIDMSWENPQCRLEGLLGICGTKPRIHDEVFDYFIGVRYQGPVPDGMEEFEVKPCTWAVFPDVLDAWKRLFTEWLPNSGYELLDQPIVECYYAPDHRPESELWVPVVAGGEPSV